ncbi:MAG: hypothetical protein IJH34_09615 [Romboutsia sp.]|nr:hypothetical protein [Romboutsia sp.]
MQSIIEKDLDNLSKNLYLEAPDLWVEFLDKVNAGIFDELVLFFATRHNYISIVQYAIENNLIDINAKSKNKEFSTIYDHLTYVAKQNKYNDLTNYFYTLKNPDEKKTQKTKNNESKTEKNTEIKKENNNIPSVICKKCKSNIFETGYIVCENKVFKYSSEEKKSVEIAREELDSVICCECNSLVENTTPKDLEALCNITTCIKCKNDLIITFIINKRNLIYNKDLNKFDLGNTYYACGKCENAISEQQKDFFKLK